MGFNTVTKQLMVIHDLDDLGYPHDLGNLQISVVHNYWLVVWNMNFMNFHSVGNAMSSQLTFTHPN